MQGHTGRATCSLGHAARACLPTPTQRVSPPPRAPPLGLEGAGPTSPPSRSPDPRAPSLDRGSQRSDPALLLRPRGESPVGGRLPSSAPGLLAGRGRVHGPCSRDSALTIQLQGSSGYPIGTPKWGPREDRAGQSYGVRVGDLAYERESEGLARERDLRKGTQTVWAGGTTCPRDCWPTSQAPHPIRGAVKGLP
jgi:hypothetical protein